MSEKYAAFIKDNRVEDILVFNSENNEQAKLAQEAYAYESFVWLNENNVAKWSTYDGKKFVPPTLDYLYSIGVSQENQAMADERIAALENES